MKYLKQISILFGVSILGDILHVFLPIRIPSSMLGLGILVLLLMTKTIAVEEIEATANFFLSFMPVLFVPATFELIEKWSLFKSLFFSIINNYSDNNVREHVALRESYGLSYRSEKTQ